MHCECQPYTTQRNHTKKSIQIPSRKCLESANHIQPNVITPKKYTNTSPKMHWECQPYTTQRNHTKKVYKYLAKNALRVPTIYNPTLSHQKSIQIPRRKCIESANHIQPNVITPKKYTNTSPKMHWECQPYTTQRNHTKKSIQIPRRKCTESANHIQHKTQGPGFVEREKQREVPSWMCVLERCSPQQQSNELSYF